MLGKNRKPERFIKVINSSDNFSDKEKALKIIESFIDYSKFINLTSILGNIEYNSQLINAIKEKIYSNSCVMCKGHDKIIIAECGHRFCLVCAKKLLTENIDCSICSASLSHSFKVKVFNSKNRMEKGCPKFPCVQCKNKQICKFLTGKCNHLCIYCVQQSYENFKTDCCECFQPLFNDTSYFEQTEICQGCGQIKYIIGDFMASLSCGHILCIECQEEAIKLKLCKICRLNLNQLQILDCLKKSCQQCSDCSLIFSKTFITKKVCCKINLCNNCESSHRCQAKSLNFTKFT